MTDGPTRHDLPPWVWRGIGFLLVLVASVLAALLFVILAIAIVESTVGT